MNDNRGGRALWKPACVLIAMALMLGPAMAGPRSWRMKRGGINPTNIAVIESDLDEVAAAPDQADDGWHEVEDRWHDEDHEVEKANLGTLEAHAFATGRGVWVAVLDAGFNLNHSAIRANLAPVAFDAIDIDDDPQDLGNGIDDDGDGLVDGALGHGTFVAGMVLEIAPDAMIVPIRVKDDEGFGTNEELVRGIEFAIDVGVDVINLSLEQAPVRTYRLRCALRAAKRRGIVIVMSAGNDGSEELSDVAEQSWMVVACASDDADRRAAFSNFSPRSSSAQIFAPGVDLLGPIGFPYDDAMARWSGTSFSAGILSGAAALARELNPQFSTEEIRNLLADSVVPVHDLDGRVMPGTGRIDLRMVVFR